MGWFSKKHKVKKGDIVVCIDDRGWNNGITSIILTYNKKYRLVDVLSTCHGHVYDIGGRFIISSSDAQYTICTCDKFIPGAGIHWAGSFRFRIAPEEEVEEFNTNEKAKTKVNLDTALDTENHELAEKLAKELEKIF